jgi:hypothetical protein
MRKMRWGRTRKEEQGSGVQQAMKSPVSTAEEALQCLAERWSLILRYFQSSCLIVTLP